MIVAFVIHGPLGLPVHEFSQHKEDVMGEPETCKGSKNMCGDSAFDQAEREAKMKEEAFKKKIAERKERLQEEKQEIKKKKKMQRKEGTVNETCSASCKI